MPHGTFATMRILTQKSKSELNNQQEKVQAVNLAWGAQGSCRNKIHIVGWLGYLSCIHCCLEINGLEPLTSATGKPPPPLRPPDTVPSCERIWRFQIGWHLFFFSESKGNMSQCMDRLGHEILVARSEPLFGALNTNIHIKHFLILVRSSMHIF
jgi:hypothetical protein